MKIPQVPALAGMTPLGLKSPTEKRVYQREYHDYRGFAIVRYADGGWSVIDMDDLFVSVAEDRAHAQRIIDTIRGGK